MCKGLKKSHLFVQGPSRSLSVPQDTVEEVTGDKNEKVGLLGWQGGSVVKHMACECDGCNPRTQISVKKHSGLPVTSASGGREK